MNCVIFALALFAAGLYGLAFAVSAFANPGGQDSPEYTKQGKANPLGYCQLSVTTAVQTSTCTGGIPAGTTYALVCNEGTAARWRDDGTAPTTSVGTPLGTGSATAPVCQTFFTTFSALQWIAESGTSVLNFTFYQ